MVTFGVETGPPSNENVISGLGDHIPPVGGDNGGGQGLTAVPQQADGMGPNSPHHCIHRCRKRGWSGRAGFGTVGGQQAMAGSEEKKKPLAVFPHSKSGRCTDLGCHVICGAIGDATHWKGQALGWWASWVGQERVTLGRDGCASGRGHSGAARESLSTFASPSGPSFLCAASQYTSIHVRQFSGPLPIPAVVIVVW
ncbi:hypothetical protein IW262DRAFT_1302103 [Armillaria fumosa]|nr:hypothetical protein IW262DRAFT_1302103 [Armillaria fumosa]